MAIVAQAERWTFYQRKIFVLYLLTYLADDNFTIGHKIMKYHRNTYVDVFLLTKHYPAWAAAAVDTRRSKDATHYPLPITHYPLPIITQHGQSQQIWGGARKPCRRSWPSLSRPQPTLTSTLPLVAYLSQLLTSLNVLLCFVWPCMEENKLTSLEATLVRNYSRPTNPPTDWWVMGVYSFSRS